ncbi:uncharacterized protein LOC134695759 [Mytilus trossulus]|uniref:uncharacterized protein LOC134695759 n=1 Tax=Mytilus trossulus TaxID=6551 RepID=UPI00300750A6
MLMNNQFIKAYVYILDGKITGFQIVYLVDGGTTGVMRSGRIRKDTQGKGVLRKLGEFIMEQNPSLTHVVFATGTNVPTIFQNIKNGAYEFVAKRACLYYQTNKHALKEHIPEIETLERTKVLNQKDLIQSIKDQDFYSQMFKDNRLIIDTVPYRLMESNIPLILMERTKAVASYLDDNNKSIITFGSYFKLSNGDIFCNLDIYGDVGKALAHHISIHIQHFVEHITDIFTIEVRCHESSPFIDKAMSENGLMLVPVGKFVRNELICVEKSYYQNAEQARL